jgi:hypothetical protein
MKKDFSKNQKGFTLIETLVVVGFIVVTLWLLLSIFSKIGHIEIRPFSGSEAMSYFSPLAALYYGRRWQEKIVPRHYCY